MSRYGRVYVINLLSQQKIEEDRLSQTLNNLLEQRQKQMNEQGVDPKLGYYNFDFHDRLAGDNYQEIV